MFGLVKVGQGGWVGLALGSGWLVGVTGKVPPAAFFCHKTVPVLLSPANSAKF